MDPTVCRPTNDTYACQYIREATTISTYIYRPLCQCYDRSLFDHPITRPYLTLDVPSTTASIASTSPWRSKRYSCARTEGTASPTRSRRRSACRSGSTATGTEARRLLLHLCRRASHYRVPGLCRCMRCGGGRRSGRSGGRRRGSAWSLMICLLRWFFFFFSGLVCI